jgi:heme/copper-type cytochrome/quinol oxidase subunit 2
MKFLLAMMRMFHHMMGITAPRPEQERKILMVWFITVLVFILIGAAFVLLIAPRLLR